MAKTVVPSESELIEIEARKRSLDKSLEELDAQPLADIEDYIEGLQTDAVVVMADMERLIEAARVVMPVIEAARKMRGM